MSLLEDNPRGFFLMVEGSQIDWGGHDNHLPYIITEMLDFDQAVGEVLKYAAQDQNTLVIVTADHETGGLALHDGDYETGYVKAEFTSLDHTGVMVPVFAFGPGADTFTGFYQNTDIFAKIMALLQQ